MFLIISDFKYEVKKMAKSTLFWLAIFCFCVVTFTVEAAEIPPVPQGYADEQAVRTAILLGQIKLIDAKNISLPDNVE